MLKIFRTMRRRLLSENRINKYLLYAIGEIILVVIGILIALQINTWNAERHIRDLEVKILKEIETNLAFDLIEIREDIEVMDSIDLASKEIKSYLITSQKPSKGFNYNVAKLGIAPHFSPNRSGYELLVSKGVEVIKKDSLRIAISNLYESAYPYYNSYEKERIQFKGDHIQPVLIKYFTKLLKPDYEFLTTFETSQDDFIKIKKEGVFLKMVYATAYENGLVQLRAKSLETKIIGLIDLIRSELDLKIR